MSTLHRLHYVSRADLGLTEADVATIVDWSRPWNEAHGVTGVLLYSGGHFSQILEGDRSTLKSLMANIRRDGRHHEVQVLNDDAVAERRFPDWTMACVVDYGTRDLLEELWWAEKLALDKAERLAQFLVHAIAQERDRPA